MFQPQTQLPPQTPALLPDANSTLQSTLTNSELDSKDIVFF